MKTLFAMSLLLLASPLAMAQKVDVLPLPDSGVRIGGEGPAGGRPSHVCIDAAEPAWLVLYSAPAVDAGLQCARPGMRRVPMKQFDTPGTRAWLRGWLKHEIAPRMRVIDAVIEAVKLHTIANLMRIQLVQDDELARLEEERRQQRERELAEAKRSSAEEPGEVERKPIQRAEDKIGRNTLCPCGSGKKYKKCCGQNT